MNTKAIDFLVNHYTNNKSKLFNLLNSYSSMRDSIINTGEIIWTFSDNSKIILNNKNIEMAKS